MAADMREVVGDENMDPSLKDRVMELLSSLPIPTADQKHAFFSWSRQVGYQATSADAISLGIRKQRKPR